MCPRLPCPWLTAVQPMAHPFFHPYCLPKPIPLARALQGHAPLVSATPPPGAHLPRDLGLPLGVTATVHGDFPSPGGGGWPSKSTLGWDLRSFTGGVKESETGYKSLGRRVEKWYNNEIIVIYRLWLWDNRVAISKDSMDNFLLFKIKCKHYFFFFGYL